MDSHRKQTLAPDQNQCDSLKHHGMARFRFCLFLVCLFVSGCQSKSEKNLEKAETTESFLVGERKLETAWNHLTAGRFAEAEKLGTEVAHKFESLSDSAWVCVGQAQAKQNRIDDSISTYDRIPVSSTPASQLARVLKADLLLFSNGAVDESETIYRDLLNESPDHSQANQGLGTLLHLAGRRRESIPYLLNVLKQGLFQESTLLMIGWDQSTSDRSDVLKKVIEQDPANPHALLGLARLALFHNEHETAITQLQQIVLDDPDRIEAQMVLGESLLNHKSDQEFLKWVSELPAESQDNPDYWYLQGLWNTKQQEFSQAVRSFAEAVKREPDHYQANYQLGQTLNRLKEPIQAQIFLQRAATLNELGIVYTSLSQDSGNVELMEKVISKLMLLGRKWEAWAWIQLVIRSQQNRNDMQQTAIALQEELNSLPLKRTDPASNPVKDFAFKSWSLGDWKGLAQSSESSTPLSKTALTGTVTFREISAKLGVQFRYQNADDPECVGTRMLEINGGGVAILDYDLNGWPDFYFTQGGDWSTALLKQIYQKENSWNDQLFRHTGSTDLNEDSISFEDTSRLAKIHEPSFSQGVAVGDYNVDGFPDLYIANIGTNRLFMNNGDGTFSDVTQKGGFSGTEWTSSCLIADLNGDGLPDIYDVNYLAGDNIHEKICLDGKGSPPECAPSHFPGEQDQLWINQGDGTFQNMTKESGIQVPDGKGLGIVAADLHQRFHGIDQQEETAQQSNMLGKLSLFIANDGAPNFLFLNQSSKNANEESPVARFKECGLLQGLAFNEQGNSEAGMGIAVADANGDHLLDFFVTNYYQETNTFYHQESGLLFTDKTRGVELATPSYHQLGFGTQFLDANLDAWSDLIVTNGHVYNLGFQDIPWKMPAQFFLNRGDGAFRELPSSQLGPFFNSKFLGRGLAVCDWNRDGKPDVVISHVLDHSAILSNQTETTGHYIKLKLVGKTSARDAIGTSISIQLKGKTGTHQLTAGDGYQASNERVILAGLGSITVIPKLTLRWPSGLLQTWNNVEADTEYLVREGDAKLFSLP